MSLVIKARNISVPVIKQMRVFHQMEGKEYSYERLCGKLVDMEYKKIDVNFDLPIRNGIGLSTEEFMQHAEAIGSQLWHKEMEHFCDELNKGIEDVGNVVVLGEGGFSFQDFVGMMEKMETSFSDSGELVPRTLIASPVFLEEFKRKLESWYADEEKLKVLEGLYNRKRQSYYEKEANRRVVD